MPVDLNSEEGKDANEAETLGEREMSAEEQALYDMGGAIRGALEKALERLAGEECEEPGEHTGLAEKQYEGPVVDIVWAGEQWQEPGVDTGLAGAGHGGIEW